MLAGNRNCDIHYKKGKDRTLATINRLIIGLVISIILTATIGVASPTNEQKVGSSLSIKKIQNEAIPYGGGGGGTTKLDFDVREIEITDATVDEIGVKAIVENKGWRQQIEVIISQRIIQQSTNKIVAESTETVVLEYGVSEIRSRLITIEPLVSGLYRYEITVTYKKDTKYSASAQELFNYWGVEPENQEVYPFQAFQFPKLPQAMITPEIAIGFLVVVFVFVALVVFRIRR